MSVHFKSLIVLLVGIGISMPAWATPKDTAKADFAHSVKIAGTKLAPGDYRFEVSPDNKTVRILRITGGTQENPDTSDQLVASVQGQWVPLRTKPDQTQVLLTRRRVREIDFKDENQAIRFARNTKNNTTTPAGS